MAFEDEFIPVDPVLLHEVTERLVERLSDPFAKKDSLNAGEWWMTHLPLLDFVEVIIPEIEKRTDITDAEKSIAIAATFFAFRTVGEYFDVSETMRLLNPVD